MHFKILTTRRNLEIEKFISRPNTFRIIFYAWYPILHILHKTPYKWDGFSNNGIRFSPSQNERFQSSRDFNGSTVGKKYRVVQTDWQWSNRASYYPYQISTSEVFTLINLKVRTENIGHIGSYWPVTVWVIEELFMPLLYIRHECYLNSLLHDFITVRAMQDTRQISIIWVFAFYFHKQTENIHLAESISWNYLK